ncbi:mRNA 3'-end-processing protein YTH1 [Bienertia sinuspersici]
MKQVVCYKCQGMDHLAKQCPNKVLVIREEYYTLLNQHMDELAIETTKKAQLSLNDEDSDFWEKQPIDGHVCSSSCHHEVVDSASIKKDRHEQALEIRRGFKLEKGVKVWFICTTSPY